MFFNLLTKRKALADMGFPEMKQSRLLQYLVPLSVWMLVVCGSADAQQLYFTNDASGSLVGLYNPNPPSLAILCHPASQVGPVGVNVAFAVLAQGTAPLSYQWQFNSNNITGAIADTLLLTNISLADFGAYRVVISNSGGSVTSSNALLQLDSDLDGMADSWEVSFFGNITNRTGFEDDDGDGISNRDEFQEGTHPKGTSSGNP